MDNGRRTPEDAFLDLIRKHHATPRLPGRAAPPVGRIEVTRRPMPRIVQTPAVVNRMTPFAPRHELWNAVEPVPPFYGSPQRLSILLQDEKESIERKQERLRRMYLERKRRIHRVRMNKTRLLREVKRDLELLGEEEEKVNAEITALEDRKALFDVQAEEQAKNEDEIKNLKDQVTREKLKKLEGKLKRDRCRRRMLKRYGEKYACYGFSPAVRSFIRANTRSDTVGYAVSENNGVAVLRSDGRCQTFGSVPSKMKSFVQGRSVTMASIGSNNRFFLQYTNAKISHATGSNLIKDAVNAGDVQCVAFGQGGRSYIVLYKDGHVKYDGIPRALEKELEHFSLRFKPVFISLGFNGEYFVRFENGLWRAGGMDSNVQTYVQKFRAEKAKVRSVVFGPGTAIVRYNP